jgi:hypothetical protein
MKKLSAIFILAALFVATSAFGQEKKDNPKEEKIGDWTIIKVPALKPDKTLGMIGLPEITIYRYKTCSVSANKGESSITLVAYDPKFASGTLTQTIVVKKEKDKFMTMETKRHTIAGAGDKYDRFTRDSFYDVDDMGYDIFGVSCSEASKQLPAAIQEYLNHRTRLPL